MPDADEAALRLARRAERIWLDPDPGAPGGWRLHFQALLADVAVRLSAADLHALRALLLDQGDLASLVARAERLARQDVPGNTAAVTALVASAHAAGYQLAAADVRAVCEDRGYVLGFLAAACASRSAASEEGELVGAIDRVLAMLAGG